MIEFEKSPKVARLMFNATFDNISAISWRLVLVVEENGVPRENHHINNQINHQKELNFADFT
jgi:hypothetical protein